MPSTDAPASTRGPAGVLSRPSAERERLSEAIAERLHGPISVVGVLFALVVIGDLLTPDRGPLHRAFFISGWVMWGLFVGEFLLRLVIAPSTGRFLRRNWWQVVFLLAPFLRFLSLMRLSRAGRGVASAVRAGRSAGSALTSRLGWLMTVTLIVILASGELLVQAKAFPSMAEALHAATLATVAGEPLRSDTGVGQVMDIVLAVYSVVVFATLAGAVGSFFVERRGDERSEASPSAPRGSASSPPG